MMAKTINNKNDILQGASYFISSKWVEDRKSYYRLMQTIAEKRGCVEAGFDLFMESVTDGICGSDNVGFHRFFEEIYDYLLKDVEKMWIEFSDEEDVESFFQECDANYNRKFKRYSSFD